MDYIEILFNKRTADEFLYSRNSNIRLTLDKAILHKNGIPYFSPELVLLYKSTDLSRDENRQDFDLMLPIIHYENKEWLRNALITVFTDEHDWIDRLGTEVLSSFNFLVFIFLSVINA